MIAEKTQLANDFGQPIGRMLPDWTPPPFPPRDRIEGTYCTLEPLDPNRHAGTLFEAFSQDRDGRDWTYLPYGPFTSFAAFRKWLNEIAAVQDPQFYAVIPTNSGQPAGLASLLRINPAMGCVEVGHIHFAAGIRRSAISSEAMFLLMQKIFDLGYRRYEWKCDALNAPSRRAAERLGFTFEGVFRNAAVYKGRNRDTAWFAIIDAEWPAVRAAFLDWLRPANFEESGRQLSPLAARRT